jgi:hypothetical protein
MIVGSNHNENQPRLKLKWGILSSRGLSTSSAFASKMSLKSVSAYQEKLIEESPRISTNDTEIWLDDISKAIYSIYIQSSKIKVSP